MKLPSVQQVADEAARTFRRFPFVLLDAAVGTAAAIVLMDHEGAARPTIVFNVLLGAIIGIPALLTVALTMEKWKQGRASSLGAQAAALLALAAYASTIPTDLEHAPMVHMFRFAMIAVAMHLFAAVVPFARTREVNGFWQFNKALLLRAITSALFSAALFIGLSVALGAVDNLFGVNVPPKRYAELWALVAGIFMTWFFIGGIPEDLDALEGEADYPKVIKLFGQYILLPLVVVYLVILYAYVGKILLAWEWPQGWVSRLILGFAGVGMLMHLLFYPIQDREENIWIRRACRWLYAAMAPLVVVFLLAVWRRTSEYGMTEGRYIAVTTGFWLGVMVLYFLLSRRRNIKFIPGSLGVISLAMCFGPWGAFSVSESSQVGRLEGLLTSTSILAGGKITPAASHVPYEQSKEISSILSYLNEVHGYDRIQPWFAVSLRADSAGSGVERKRPPDVAKLLGVEFVYVWEGKGSKDVSLQADRGEPLSVAGYDRYWRLNFFSSANPRRQDVGGGFGFRVSPALDTLTLYAGPEGAESDSLRLDMREFVEAILASGTGANIREVSPEKMARVLASDRLRVKVYLLSLYAKREDGNLKFNSYECAFLYSVVPGPAAAPR